MDRARIKPSNRVGLWTKLWASNHLDLVTIAFIVSILSYIASTAWDFGVLSAIVGLAGIASCGFSWLMARAVFRPDAHREVWPLLIVLGLIVTGVLLTLFAGARQTSGWLGYALGFASSVHVLLSSSVLLLALVEAFLGFHADLPKREKQFRIVFAVGYMCLLGISVLWLNGAPEGSWAAQSSDQIKMMCAGLAIVLSAAAWRFRRQHALPRPKRLQRRLTHITDQDKHLASRIMHSLEEDRLYLEPDLKLPVFARRLGETAHQVSACITGVLGFRNFNALINKYRIESAKVALISPNSREQSILTIAMDTGFSSIGPFNRAFKSETGLTPSEFRKMN